MARPGKSKISEMDKKYFREIFSLHSKDDKIDYVALTWDSLYAYLVSQDSGYIVKYAIDNLKRLAFVLSIFVSIKVILIRNNVIAIMIWKFIGHTINF